MLKCLQPELDRGMKVQGWAKKIRLNPMQILAIGFFSVIIIGSLLLNLPIATRSGTNVGYLNALFTSTSAVCVTGLTVVDVGNTYSLFGQIVTLLLIQIGGLGFMTVATLVFLVLGKQRLRLESCQEPHF